MTDPTRARMGKPITEFFSNLPRPRAEEIGSSGPGEFDSIERTAVIEFYSRYTAEELNGHIMKSYKGDKGAAMHFMSGKAVAYFLPAFMEVYLENEKDVFNLSQSILSVLNKSLENSSLYDALTSTYSAEQKAIIRMVLTVMNERLAPEGIGPPPLPSDIRDCYWS